MAFCRNCGAPKADENAQCSQCGAAGQYYQPMPYMPPPPKSPDEDVGKALGIVALIIVIIIIVTVVLAAVMYVMVIGMESSSVGEYAPVGSWNSVEATSSTSGIITFGYFTEEIEFGDLEIIVQEDGVNIGHIAWTGDTSSGTVDMNWIGGPSGASAEYIDYNMAGGNVNRGDHITLNGLKPDTTYSFQIYHLPSDSVVSMTGSSSFTTEP